MSLLSVRALTKRFGGFTAVNRVSFELAQGEILGLIGPNGSGKSTTFNVIAGLYQPSEGEIVLDGQAIAGLAAHEICRKGLARTFQIPRPFRKLGILENTVLAAYYGSSKPVTKAQAEKHAIDALQLIGLPFDAEARVDGLGAAGLKKLEMARALATKPRLLLADESLGGLDENEMAAAADMLKRIRDERGVTIIWVEHIMGVLMKVIDRCIVLDHGELIAQGSPSEVTRDPKVVEVYLGRDATQVQQQADAGKTGTGEIADCSIRLARHNQRQRAGPEAFGQLEGRGVENAFGSGLSKRGDMGNQRVELRAAFGGIERGNGRGLGGIRAQAIDGLGRKTDKPAGAQQGARAFETGGIRDNPHGVPIGVYATKVRIG